MDILFDKIPENHKGKISECASNGVLPCRNRSDEEAIRDIVKLWGGNSRRVDWLQTNYLTPPLRTGYVVSIGERWAHAGTTYAALTGRGHLVVKDACDVDGYEGSLVFICGIGETSVPLYESLHSLSTSGRSIGLITGVDEDQLWRQVLRNAAVVALSSTGAVPRMHSRAIIPNGRGGALKELFYEVVGTGTDVDGIRRCLTTPSAVLGFVGHSDGVDARLSDDVVLCSRITEVEAIIRERPANCDVTGYCHRKHMVRSDAIHSGQLLSPQDIAARVLVLMSCYVARTSDCSVTPKGALLAQLLDAPRVGNIVASWELAFPTIPEFTLMTLSMLEGRSLGSAIQIYNAVAEGALVGCNRYLLFGDPDVVVSPSLQLTLDGFSSWHEDEPIPEPIPIPEPTGVISPDAWLRSRITYIKEHPKFKVCGGERINEKQLQKADQAITLLSTTQQARSTALNELLEVIVEYEGSGFVHWFNDALGLPKYVPRVTTCFGCNRPGRIFELNTRHEIRWMACCTQCDSFYADVPVNSNFVDCQFEVLPDGSISHDIPPSSYNAGLLNIRSSIEQRWTSPLASGIDLTALPPGRSWIWLHLIGDMGLFSYSRLYDNRPYSISRETITC